LRNLRAVTEGAEEGLEGAPERRLAVGED